MEEDENAASSMETVGTASSSRGSSESPMVEVNIEKMWSDAVHGNAGKEEWNAYSKQPDDPGPSPEVLESSIPLPWDSDFSEHGQFSYKSEQPSRSYLGRERSLSPKACRVRQKNREDEMAYREDLFLM
ncbi:hypothetical protein HK097_003622 [Rhizophlyctis rosea]|uniref:Uncharacterized protein n=1 Tax=Rhizophlyctis rosea TaxID=64517 RepID=A0AAD5X2Y2_9FUNG|nr:hypothetical protein HK097_003622 [Rhizophlyctis rosea]